MIVTIILVLLALWFFGLLADIGGSLIHLILLAVAIAVVYRLIARRA